LIGGILMDARESPSYFKTFYLRRVFRIVPVYYLWVLLYIALVSLAGDEVVKLSNSGIRPPLDAKISAFFLFLHNSFSISLFGLAGSWFGHLWSLAVEEQFYLVAPLVVRVVPPRHLKWVLAGVVLAAILARLAFRSLGNMPAVYITTRTVCRMDALAMGMLAAIVVRSDACGAWIGRRKHALHLLLALLAAGVFVLWLFAYGSATPGMQTVGFTWMAAFYAVLLLLAVERREGLLASILRSRVLRELGTVSYCVYLIHLVMNVGLHAVLLRAPPRISTAAGGVTALALALTYLVAKMSWLLLEGPLQRRGHAFKY